MGKIIPKILKFYKIREQDYDFIGQSGALKRIGSLSGSLNSKFRIRNGTIIAEITDRLGKNTGDFGYQFEDLCKDTKTVGELYLATSSILHNST